MPTRREFLAQSTAAGLVIAASIPKTFAAEARDAGSNAPKPMYQLGSRIKSAVRREETIRRYRGFGSSWHMSWAGNDLQYVSLCNGTGFSSEGTTLYNSRLFAIEGEAGAAKFHDLPGYPLILQPANHPSYYNFGTLALDGYIYQFLSTTVPKRASPEHDPKVHANRAYCGVKLIYSRDNGRIWRNQDGSTPVIWEDWSRRTRETLVFFEEDRDVFSLLSVLQMGKNYGHNRDGYVYVYSPNGNTEGTMNQLVMFRVPKAEILNRRAYEFFAGRHSNGNAKWSGDLEGRAVVCTFPHGWVSSSPHSWQPSITYNAPLGLYMMANWGWEMSSPLHSKPSYLGLWVARQPWGPWMQIHEETAWMPAGDAQARAYQPQIAPKWVAADGKSFWLAWSDNQGVQEDHAAQRWWAERRERWIRGQLSQAEKLEGFSLWHKLAPNYAFNLQRIDLITA